jgi:hypothetical protein
VQKLLSDGRVKGLLLLAGFRDTRGHFTSNLICDVISVMCSSGVYWA